MNNWHLLALIESFSNNLHLICCGRHRDADCEAHKVLSKMLTITCKDMGYTCGDSVSGSNLDEILEACKDHARNHHGMTDEEVNSPERIEQWRGAIKQASRPGAIRTPRTVS